MANLDNSTQQMMQQQQAQAAQAAREAQKPAKTTTKPSVQFSDVLKNQQKNGGNATVRMLKNNPVAGAEVVKSAVSGGKSSGSSKLVTTGNANAASSTGTSTGSSSANSTTTTGSTDTASGTGSVMDQSYKLMEMNQDFNLQYLNLQENMQAESRQYTAMSNVSKTKTDTAKNSLSNVK